MYLAPEPKDFWLLGGWFCLAGGILPSELSSRQNRCHPDWARTQVWIGGSRPDLLGRRLVNTGDSHRQDVPVSHVVELWGSHGTSVWSCPPFRVLGWGEERKEPVFHYFRDLSRASQLSCRQKLSCLFCRWESGLWKSGLSQIESLFSHEAKTLLSSVCLQSSWTFCQNMLPYW